MKSPATPRPAPGRTCTQGEIPTSRSIRRLLRTLLESHGFDLATDNECWWYRAQGEHAQALRVVVWGLGSKPAPHLFVEVVAHYSEAWLDERASLKRRAGHDPREQMVAQKISLTQPWSQVVDQFEAEVLPLLLADPMAGLTNEAGGRRG